MDGSVVFARWRQCALRVTHASFSPPELTTQTASRSVQPFLHSSRGSVAGHAGHALPPQNYPFSGGSGPLSSTWFLEPSELTTQMARRSVQPFLQGSRLCQTDRQTTLYTRYVTIVVRRCGLKSKVPDRRFLQRVIKTYSCSTVNGVNEWMNIY